MPRAERDLEDIYRVVDAQRSSAAFRWFKGLERAVLTLEQAPGRCPVTPESRNLRQLLFGNKPHIYRVIYRIVERQKAVEILHIRHGAMDRFEPEDLDNPPRA
jgi:plasmid stabilization system protein ParE